MHLAKPLQPWWWYWKCRSREKMLPGTLIKARERPFPFWLKPGFPGVLFREFKIIEQHGENSLFCSWNQVIWYHENQIKDGCMVWLVERSRSLMRRTTFSKKPMEWLCFALQEASKDRKKHTRRWKLSNNRFSRFISIATAQRENIQQQQHTLCTRRKHTSHYYPRGYNWYWIEAYCY